MLASKIVDFNFDKRNDTKIVHYFGCVHNYSVQLQNFLNYCKLSLAKKTYQGYKSKLKIFEEWLENDLQVTAITRKMIIDFTIYLAEKELAKKTIEQYIFAFNSFFNYLIDNEIIETSPVEKIKSINVLISSCVRISKGSTRTSLSIFIR